MKRIWRCRKSTVIPKTKKRRYCDFSTSDQKGTFLHNCYIPAWKILIFINHFLSHLWDHKTIQTCLGLSSRIIVDWHVFCAEVCAKWFDNQEAIGGENIEVEIDETQFVRRKYNRGRLLKDIWLFGGVERISKKRFVVALTGEVGERRDRATLFPLSFTATRGLRIEGLKSIIIMFIR